jgi:hypothetical protein
MKKIFMFSIVIVFLVAGSAMAITSYDFILKDKGIKEWNQIYTNNVKAERVMMDYLNLIVNEQNIVRILERDKCDKEILRFTKENPRIVTMIIHMIVIQDLNKSDVSDNQIIFVTGVIKDPRAQVATNGPQYEQEKQGWRAMYPAYATWEVLTEQGNLKALTEKVFTSFKKNKK